MKKSFLYLLLFLFLVSCQQKSKPLNIVVLYTDDQRFNTIRALGNDEIYTPNMDRLVKMGVSFTRAHVMGGHHGAVCAPSRAMLLTGKPYFNITKDFIDKKVPYTEDFDFTTFPEFFREKGYNTFFTGKWHNHTGKIREGFQNGENIFIGGMHFPQNGGHERPELWDYDPTGEYPQSKKITRDTFSSEIYSNAAVRFIHQQTENQPFCLYAAYTSPHDPRTAPQAFLDLYDTANITLPANFMPEHPFNNGHLNIRDELLAPFPRTPERIKEEIKGYYAMVSEVDAQIGRVLDALESKNLLENTVIVFAGDNGLAVGQHGLLGKQSVYDHSVRIPLIIAAPNIKGNRQANTLAYIHDIFPTICNIMGHKPPTSSEGKSLMPALKDENTKVREALFLSHGREMRAIRTDDDWKYIRYFVAGETHEQLYNINDDPLEINNLASDSKFRDKKQALQQQLIKGILKSNDDFIKPKFQSKHTGFGAPVEVTMATPFENLEVRYTTDGSTPNASSPLYTAPFLIEDSTVLQAQIFLDDEPQQDVVLEHLMITRAVKSVELSNPPHPKYSGQGKYTLVDRTRGSRQFKDGKWLGYEGEDVEITIELEKGQTIEEFGISYLTQYGSWIFAPSSYEFSVSEDGKSFQKIKKIELISEKNTPSTVHKNTFKIEPISPRFIRFSIKNTNNIPAWHSGKGQKAWMFIDELVF